MTRMYDVVAERLAKGTVNADHPERAKAGTS